MTLSILEEIEIDNIVSKIQKGEIFKDYQVRYVDLPRDTGGNYLYQRDIKFIPLEILKKNYQNILSSADSLTYQNSHKLIFEFELVISRIERLIDERDFGEISNQIERLNNILEKYIRNYPFYNHKDIIFGMSTLVGKFKTSMSQFLERAREYEGLEFPV